MTPLTGSSVLLSSLILAGMHVGLETTYGSSYANVLTRVRCAAMPALVSTASRPVKDLI